MARFYKTATPEFTEDFMYTPPWELAGKIMEANEQGIQNTLASTSIFEDFDIQHLEDPVLKEQAAGIQDKYTSSAEEITKSLQAELSTNPQAWRSHLPKIGKLAQELKKDFKSGDIFKMMSDSQRASTWVAENKDKNPELFNAAYNAITEDFRSDPERKKEWSAGIFKNISKFDINSKEIVDAVKDYETRSMQQPDGKGGLIEVKYKDKNELIRNYMNTVLADPEAQRYMQQATALGLPGFVDSKGKPIPLKIPVSLETGKRVSEEEFNKERERFLDPNLSREDRVKQGMTEFKYDIIPNSEFAWTRNFTALADRIGGEISRKYTADPVYSAEVKRRHDYSLAKFKHDLGLEKIQVEKLISDKKAEEKASAELSVLNNEVAAMEASGDTSSAEYKKKKAKLKGITDSNVNLIRDNYTNVNFEKSQRVLKGGENNIEYNYIRNIDNNVLEDAFSKTYLKDAYQRVKEGDRTTVDFNQVVVETYLAFNDSISENFDTDGTTFGKALFGDRKGSQENSNQAIKEFIATKYGKTEKDFTRAIQAEDKYGNKYGPITYANTPWFDNILKKMDSITQQKKISYNEYSVKHKDSEIAGITPVMEQKLRKEYSEGFSAYDFIPASHSKFKDGKYRDPTDESKPIKFPTKEEMMDTGRTTFSGVTPYSPIGITPIVEFEGNKFYVVNNQGVTEATERNRRLFLDEDGYTSADSFKLMSKNIKDAGHRNIVNSLTSLKNLAMSGVTKKNKDMPRWEVNPSTGRPVLGDDGQPKEMIDPRTKKPIPSEYNEIDMSTGIGEVFTIREYYNSGRDTPFVTYKDGEFASSDDNLLIVSKIIGDYINLKVEEINKDSAKQESREEYKIKE